MSWYYQQAFHNHDDPYYACQYGITTNPSYGRCDICPSFSRCSMPHKQAYQLREFLEQVADADDDTLSTDYKYERGKAPACSKNWKACGQCSKLATDQCVVIKAIWRDD